MICKIWGFHCGDYEECRLVGYKNPVLNSTGDTLHFPRIKRHALEAEHSPATSAKVKKSLELYIHSLWRFMSYRLVKHKDNIPFTLPNTIQNLTVWNYNLPISDIFHWLKSTSPPPPFHHFWLFLFLKLLDALFRNQSDRNVKLATHVRQVLISIIHEASSTLPQYVFV
jgi:hypothetical protein